MCLCSVLLFSTLTLAASDPGKQPPTGNEVVAKMMERDRERQAALEGYTARRRYVLDNQRHHERAEMLVRMTCLKDGSKEFEIVSSDGWGAARNHVFPRLLSAEAEASQPDARERSRITSQNYDFEMIGSQAVNQRPAWVIAVTPKTANKYLMKGKIWVDAEDYAITRIEGEPAKNPSFWTKSVHFVHTYSKQGPFWFPTSDESITDVRILGTTGLKIDYFEYVPNATVASVVNPSAPWRRP